ncbi:ectonucleoside triphosphate diphosphohydrolase 4-like isoform X2 [Tubulanus polymorphus]|uniref:ectonucleoside triphosphate diphosphohydrolase 4-like isoform X2 n=1 Tax=Tubulanus polymorphus TaxID=672921 RepID=UPI003DA3B261
MLPSTRSMVDKKLLSESWYIRCSSIMNGWRCNGRTPIVFLATVAMGMVLFMIVIYRFDFTAQFKHLAPGHKHSYKKKTGTLRPTDLDNPNQHYGIVVDAGSSGSRIFVYFWPTHDGNPKDLLNIDQVVDKDFQPVVKKVNPGLSSFSKNPAEVGQYIRPLLTYAANHVPKSKHRETPVYVLATAGMRMISESAQQKIMENVRLEIKMNFDFLFTDEHVEIISGKQEGVYAWIATNNVLGRFHHEGEPCSTEENETEVMMHSPDTGKHRRKRTVGIIDMGGGSVQIAFEIPKSVGSDQPIVNKNLIADFNLGCKNSDDDHNYRVYVTTFLGFGANSARQRYEELIINEAVQAKLTVIENGTRVFIGSSRSSPIFDPCLPVNLEQVVNLKRKIYHLKGSGDYISCQQKLRPLLNSTGTCSSNICSMNGVYQPEIDFESTEFYGFSEYFYTMDDLLRMAGHYNYAKFIKSAKDYCTTKWPVLEAWYRKRLFPKADTARFQDNENWFRKSIEKHFNEHYITLKRFQCFKSAWIVQVLHGGFKFPRNYNKFNSVQLIDGKEVQWTLGALLYRTRYFPLREIQQQKFQHAKSVWKSKTLYLNQYVLLLCFVMVVVATILHLHRLQRIHMIPGPSLSRVPSSSRIDELEKSQFLNVHSYT